jgi:hypothetical protein
MITSCNFYWITDVAFVTTRDVAGRRMEHVDVGVVVVAFCDGCFVLVWRLPLAAECL